eukprot:Nk52_evm1s1084 gene=Nk52_evmTU1s1084
MHANNRVNKIVFEKQPPSNIRKSNFFHFVCSFFDADDEPLEVLHSKFVSFFETDGVFVGMTPLQKKVTGKATNEKELKLKGRGDEKSDDRKGRSPVKDKESRPAGREDSSSHATASRGGQSESSPASPSKQSEKAATGDSGMKVTFRNGVCYEFTFKRGKDEFKQKLYLRLIDCFSKELVMYEGDDKEESLARCLLTHEECCNRCKLGKSCGNKKDTPADPRIQDKFFADFSIKCNQNCLKGAGRICNPDSIRKFQLIFLDRPEYETGDECLAVSVNIFAHNNSKYGRKSELKSSEDGGGPSILCINPSQAWVHGGSTVTIVGDNFNEKHKVMFGNLVCNDTAFLSPHALSVQVPATTNPGIVDVSLLTSKDKAVKDVESKKFVYLSASDPKIETGIEKLAACLRTDNYGFRTREDVLEESAKLLKDYVHQSGNSIQKNGPVRDETGCLEKPNSNDEGARGTKNSDRRGGEGAAGPRGSSRRDRHARVSEATISDPPSPSLQQNSPKRVQGSYADDQERRFSLNDSQQEYYGSVTSKSPSNRSPSYLQPPAAKRPRGARDNSPNRLDK